MATRLTEIRKRLGLSVADVATAIGTHPHNYYRIERGVQQPKRELARAMFELFNGEATLGDCYDPEFADTLRPDAKRTA